MTTVPFRSKQSAIGILRKLLPAAGDRAPLSAMLEIADRCNEVCVHCYQVQGQKGELPTEDWRRILDELADMGVLFLTLSGGEATLRKDFIELVAHARRRGFAVKIFTNGLSMTDELAQALADLAVQEVQITLYSPRAEVHDWVTRVPGSFEKVLAGARALRTRDVAVVLKTPLMSFNVEDRHAYVALARELDTDFMLDPGLDAREDGDRNPQQFSISHDQWKAVQVDEKLGRKSQRGGPLEPALDSAPCGACTAGVHIEPNGEMRPCGQLDTSVGHAVKDGVEASWYRNPQAREIRALKWRDLHGCRDCDLQPYCHRCYASARREAGDALGPYRSACDHARLRYELRHGVAPTARAGEGVERDLSVGPYSLGEDHQIVTRPDTLTSADLERRERLAWAKGEPSAAPASASPGQLVQIRRPGLKKSEWEAVPRAYESDGVSR
ncbi:MAG: radical SAM protein [Sandaracinaceae bacterium]